MLMFGFGFLTRGQTPLKHTDRAWPLVDMDHFIVVCYSPLVYLLFFLLQIISPGRAWAESDGDLGGMC